MTERQQVAINISGEVSRELTTSEVLNQLLERLDLSLPEGFEDAYRELCDQSRYTVPDYVRTDEPANQSGVIAAYELQRVQSINVINTVLERIVRRDDFARRTMALPEMLSRAIICSADEDPDDQRLVDGILQEFEALARLAVDARSDLVSGQADVSLLAAELQILTGVSQQLLGLIQQIEGQRRKKAQPDAPSLLPTVPATPPYPLHPPRTRSDAVVEMLSRSQELEAAAVGLQLDVWTGPSVDAQVGRVAIRNLFQKGAKAI